MDRPHSESPDKKSFNRTTGPSDQWQTRSVSPLRSQTNPFTSTSDSHQSFRPLVPNPLPCLAPNFGNQRFFTPRSSYFGQQNDNYVFSSSVTNMNPNYNYGQNYANNDYNMGPTRPYSSFESMSANRPVFSTDLSNITINIEDLNQLKKALINANQTTESENRKNYSPESTNTCDDPSDPSQPSSTPNSMDHLIDEMKKLTEEQKKIKKTRRDVDKKISDLDEELKAYEKKFNLRESLKKCKIDFERDEEELENKMRKVVSEMDKINKNHNFSLSVLSRNSTPSPVITHSELEVVKSPKKDVNKSNPTPIPNPVLKRPNPSILKTNQTKKVRISSDVVDSSGLSSKINICSPIKTTPKMWEKPVYRRTPIPSKLGLNSKPTPATNSPKINRICRQQPQNPTPSGVTSGVRTSRPVKMLGSRSKRSETSEETTKSAPITESSEISKTANQTSVPSQKSGSISTEIESDNEVFKELEKINSKINSSIEKNLPEMPIIFGQTETTTDPKEITDDRVEEHSPQTCDLNDKQNSVEKDSTNTQKDIEMIAIDSEDEDFSEQEEQQIVVKSEKPDSIVDSTFDSEQMKRIREESNNLLSETSRKALNIHSRTSSISSEGSVGSETSTDRSSVISDNRQTDSPFKTPAEPSPVKKQYKYCGIDPIYEEPTVIYSLSSFKAIAGPKSKTASASIIFFKTFKDYLFASFMDCTVRRYHIEDKQNVMRYEGHEGFVLALVIVKCPQIESNYVLYTGGRDRKIRAFNAITGQFLNSILMTEEITAMVYQWSHIFCAFGDGNVCKISPIHETNDQNIDYLEEMEQKRRKFPVNLNKRISALVEVIVTEPTDNDIEGMVAFSANKLRIINTKDSINDSQRILDSFPVHCSPPMLMKTFRNLLIISFKVPPVKNEDKTKREEKSRIMIFDLQKKWTAIMSTEMKGLITSLELCKQDLIVSTFVGKIQCIDCEKLELKWITYGHNVTATAKIGNRLVLGNNQGMIDVIYLDQQFIDCQTCGVTFARHIDYKKHIQLEHTLPVAPVDAQQISK